MNLPAKLRKLYRLLFNQKRVLLIDLDAMRNDEEFRIAWQSAITKTMKEEFCRFKVQQGLGDVERFQSFSDKEMHIVANNAASIFIDQLTK